MIATTVPAQGVQARPLYCLPLVPPYLPTDPADLRAYQDQIIADFEAYMAGVTDYFTCLDRERDRALAEARRVGETYRAFQATITP